jgi:hypothetical protein
MIPEIPKAWKAISGHTSLTSFISTEEGFVAMSMHSVHLTLMAKKECGRWEPEFFTGLDLTPIRLKVRVHKSPRGKGLVSAQRL